ncbi:MAG TPA: HNH endonuclease signature motif containing protein [Streptosporangiaceae bacterium]|jgi:hypothetical protein
MMTAEAPAIRGARPPGIADLPPEIASRIIPDPVTGCWVAQGRPDQNGYIRFRGERLHRTVWKLLAGPIPPKYVIDHVFAAGCINPACCRPGHTEAVTQRENVLRGRSFAAVNAAKTECDHGHAFTRENTYIRRDGHRNCRQCARDRRARARADASAVLRLAA